MERFRRNQLARVRQSNCVGAVTTAIHSAGAREVSPRVFPRREKQYFPAKQTLTAQALNNMGRPMGFEPTTTGITIRHEEPAAALCLRGSWWPAWEIFARFLGAFCGVWPCCRRFYFPIGRLRCAGRTACADVPAPGECVIFVNARRATEADYGAAVRKCWEGRV